MDASPYQEILQEAEDAYFRGDLDLVEQLCGKVIAECDNNLVAFADATRQLGRLAIFRGDFAKALDLSNSALAVSLKTAMLCLQHAFIPH